MHLVKVVTVSTSLFSLAALATSTPALEVASSEVQAVEVHEPRGLLGGLGKLLSKGSKGDKTPDAPKKPPPAPSKPPTLPPASKQPDTKPSSNPAAGPSGKSSAAPSPSASTQSAVSNSKSASSSSKSLSSSSVSSSSVSSSSVSSSSVSSSSTSSAPACQRSGKPGTKAGTKAKGGSVAARAGGVVAPRDENTAIGGVNNVDPTCDEDGIPRAQMDCSGAAAGTCATMCYAANCFGSSKKTGLQLEGKGVASQTGQLGGGGSESGNRVKAGCTNTIKEDLANQGVTVNPLFSCDEWPPNRSAQGGTGAIIQMVGNQAAQAAAVGNTFGGQKKGRKNGLILMRKFTGVPECNDLAAGDTSKCGTDPKFMMFTAPAKGESRGKYRMATFANLGQAQAPDFEDPAQAAAAAAGSPAGQ